MQAGHRPFLKGDGHAQRPPDEADYGRCNPRHQTDLQALQQAELGFAPIIGCNGWFGHARILPAGALVEHRFSGALGVAEEKLALAAEVTRPYLAHGFTLSNPPRIAPRIAPRVGKMTGSHAVTFGWPAWRTLILSSANANSASIRVLSVAAPEESFFDASSFNWASQVSILILRSFSYEGFAGTPPTVISHLFSSLSLEL